MDLETCASVTEVVCGLLEWRRDILGRNESVVERLWSDAGENCFAGTHFFATGAAHTNRFATFSNDFGDIKVCDDRAATFFNDAVQRVHQHHASTDRHGHSAECHSG